LLFSHSFVTSNFSRLELSVPCTSLPLVISEMLVQKMERPTVSLIPHLILKRLLNSPSSQAQSYTHPQTFDVDEYFSLKGLLGLFYYDKQFHFRSGTHAVHHDSNFTCEIHIVQNRFQQFCSYGISCRNFFTFQPWFTVYTNSDFHFIFF